MANQRKQRGETSGAQEKRKTTRIEREEIKEEKYHRY
jgi:hypothetical protein